MPNDLALASHRLGWEFSDAMKAFYMITNGTDGFASDTIAVNAINDLKVLELHTLSRLHTPKRRCLKFANWLVDSEEYAALEGSGEIVLVHGAVYKVICANFAVFLELCISRGAPFS